MNIMHFIATILLSLATLFGYHEPAQQPTALGSFLPVQGTQYFLSGAGVTSSATSITLTSFTTPDGRKLTMSMFGDKGYAALEPGTSKLEDVTFAGIVQNSNNTATLTGVSRGMDFISPYAASTTLAKAHAGGSTFILTNTAGFYGQQFLFANNVSTSSAVLIFSSTTPPKYDGDTTASGNELVSFNQLNNIVIAGAGTSTYTNMGLVQLANQAQVGSSTASSTAGGPLVIENIFATTTPGTQCTSGTFRCIVATALGKISQTWLDLTADFTFTGAVSIPASSAKNLTLNSIAYVFPTAQAPIASSTLMNDASGNLKWYGATGFVVASTSYPVWSGSVSSTTVFSYTVPANTVVAGTILRAKMYFSSINAPTGNTLEFDAAFGYATNTIKFNSSATILSESRWAVWQVDLVGVGNSSQAILSTLSGATSTPVAATPYVAVSKNQTQQQLLQFQVQKDSSASLQPVFSTLEIIR